ncbi:TatD family hydrolase [Patescibacteria group bacterium]|nr:TatD family hydrolase [Patescibacteria group bacterium]
MFDTHAHVNFNAFKDDFSEVIKRAQVKNISMVNVGSQYSTSRRAVELAEQFENVYAAIGLHPVHLEETDIVEEGETFSTRKEEFDFEKYFELTKNKKVVAIGEAGLDFYHIPENVDREAAIEKQKKVFHDQIRLANESNLPLIVHCRGTKENADEAYKQILAELKNDLPKKRGIMHCYGGAVELVKSFTDLGFYISFNGIITFDKTGKVEKILRETPDEKILLETDCPYLTPVPLRGKRNEPAFVKYIARKIAEIKGLKLEEVEKITDENAQRLFGL